MYCLCLRTSTPRFCPADLSLEGKPRQRKADAGAKGVLRTIKDKPLFILIYEKIYAIQVMHGLQFGLSQSQGNYWIYRLLPILKEALPELGLTPEHDPQAVANSAC